MRTSLRHALAFFVLGACTATPAVTVVHEKEPIMRGDAVKIRRGAQEPFATVKAGFFVIRTRDDWAQLWEDGKDPGLPPTLDMSRSMLVLAVSEAKTTTAIVVKRIVDVGEYLDIVVKEQKPGEGCVGKADRQPFDAVIVDRIDKPVKFFVEDEIGEACGSAPTADVQCRVGNNPQWSPKITAQIGDVVECNMTAKAGGRFEVTDRVLHLDSLPAGSVTKLAYSAGPMRGTFNVDVFGTYKIRAEATDDSGRKGLASAQVVVDPPKTSDVLVQLVWTGFDANDDPETFPRVRLVATEEGPKGRECTSDAPVPGMCEAKRKGAFTNMKILSGAPKKLALTVKYADERVEKGPAVCIQTYTNGERAFETCDRKHRDADEVWGVGLLDPATGKLGELPPAPPPAPSAKPTPSAKPAPPPKK